MAENKGCLSAASAKQALGARDPTHRKRGRQGIRRDRVPGHDRNRKHGLRALAGGGIEDMVMAAAGTEARPKPA